MNLNWLLAFIPIAFTLEWMGANPILVFLTSALAIVPLAGLMGEATEVLAKYLGPTLGGLLNASLGNAPEIIIAGCPPAPRCSPQPALRGQARYRPPRAAARPS